jgi:hypothetical protein
MLILFLIVLLKLIVTIKELMLISLEVAINIANGYYGLR